MTLELNGKQVVEVEIDCYGLSQEEIDSGKLLFTYAEFETGKPLTDNQLVRLSKKYPEVIYTLVADMMSPNSPSHAKYKKFVA